LERSCTALGIHRAVVLRFDPIDAELKATHQWTQVGVAPINLSRASENYPWLISKIQSGEIVILNDVDDAPAEAYKDLREAHKHQGRAAVCIPLRIGGELAGAVAFVSTVPRSWTAQTIEQLTRITEIFGIALERQRAAIVIRRLREESQDVLRIVPMAEVTASLAHELNQPLGAILNNAQAARRLLGARRPDIKELRDALEGIVRDVTRATDIVRHTREVFQSITEAKGSFDIRELLLDVERMLASEAKARGISLRVTLPASLPGVRGNRQGMIQVLMNLVLNAFDSVAESSKPPRIVEINAEPNSAVVHVRVRDTGKGIDPEVLPRLFNAFVTTKGKGTGIGLAIARSIIEKSGGRIWVAQNAGPGATI